MYKMVISDFFGTLINGEEAIPLSTMLELDRIRKSGVVFTITTSGSMKDVIDYNRDFPFIDYIVAFNGSYVYDVYKNEVIYSKTIPSTTVLKISKMFKDKDLCFYTDENCNYTGIHKDENYNEIVIDVGDFLLENKGNIYKIKVYFANMKEAKKAVECMEDAGIKSNCYLKKECNDIYLEITNVNDDKYKGVLKVLKKANIKGSDVLAICSSSSSKLLVSKVGCSYAVKNADKDILKAAKKTVGTNEEKGVEQVIKDVFKSV